MTDPAFLTPPLAIEPGFLDHNGHVNMAYHLVLADRTLDLAFADFGAGPDDGRERGFTTFTGEAHVRYLREINAGDAILGRVLIVDGDAKRVLWAVELTRPADGAVTTTVEGVSLAVSPATRRVAAFPDDVQARIAAAVERCAQAAAELAWLGRRVGMGRPA